MSALHSRAFAAHSPFLSAFEHFVLSLLFETFPDLAKANKLLGRKNPPYCQLVFGSQTGEFSLRGLHFL
jgi:hypothetical protein